MKKTFTSLLALAGMVVGFTLTSCGGGGGGGDEDIIQLSGLEITTGAGLGNFTMQITERSAVNLYTALYNGEEGSFRVVSLTGKTLKGQMWFSDINASSDLAYWFGFGSGSGTEVASEGGNPVYLKLTFTSEDGGTLAREGTVVLWNNNTKVSTIDLATGKEVKYDGDGIQTSPTPDDKEISSEFTVTSSCKGIKDLF